MSIQFAKLALVALLVATPVFAANPPGNERHDAVGTKMNQYISEGFYVGGDSSVTSAKLVDIRRAKAKGYERVVFALEPLTNGKQASLPHFMAKLATQENRIIVSIWGNIDYDYAKSKVQKLFAKSQHVKRINVVPRLEEGLTIVELLLAKTKKPAQLEAFYLQNPSRIVLDIQ